MRIYPECIPCLLRRVLYETELVDPAKGHLAMRAALDVMARDYRPDMVSVELATAVHHAVYRTIESDDPYGEIKRESNRVASALSRKVEDYLAGFRDADRVERLRAYMRVAIIGNILDFGIRGGASSPDDLAKKIETYLREELGWDDTVLVDGLLSAGGRSVFYLTDNAGEVVYDRYLIEFLNEEYDAEITVLVKGAPILSDATMEDALEFRLDRHARLATTGSGYVGINLDHLDEEIRVQMLSADLVISKGMANFEALSDVDIGPIAYLMRTKCRPVAESVGAPLDRSVIKVFGVGDEKD